ncbi:hypothetical protein [Streptomyces sp. NPDC005336]|uniref:hypothetical protein n=1 Tax=unclassified Streptomyces TaxID=2593676 RepID=UPI0033AA80C4
MSGRRMRTICAVSLMAALAPAAAGCSDGGGEPSSAVSRASAAIRSAEASAKAELKKIKGGANAKGDVKAGSVSLDESGRAMARITITNKSHDTANYAIEVNFRDADGDLVDATLLRVPSVRPHTPKKAVARSHRKLTGHITAQIGHAVRY